MAHVNTDLESLFMGWAHNTQAAIAGVWSVDSQPQRNNIHRLQGPIGTVLEENMRTMKNHSQQSCWKLHVLAKEMPGDTPTTTSPLQNITQHTGEEVAKVPSTIRGNFSIKYFDYFVVHLPTSHDLATKTYWFSLVQIIDSLRRPAMLWSIVPTRMLHVKLPTSQRLLRGWP